MRARVTLLLLSSLLGLGLCEAAARALHLSKTWTSYRASRDLDLAHSVTPERVGFRRWPGRSWPMPFGKTFSANGEGFRDRDFPKAKKADTTRIVFLGDSVTEGYGVEPSERFSAVVAAELERRSPGRFEVLNFGVAAHATVDEFVVLRDHALAYLPDLVVLQLGWNDLSVNRRELALLELPGAAARDGSSVDTQEGAASPSAEPPPERGPKSFLQQHSALYLALAERWNLYWTRRGGANRILNSVLATPVGDWQATERILDGVLALASAHGAKLLVAYLPLDVEVQTPEPARSRSIDDRVRAFCAGRPGVVHVDTLSALRRHSREGLYLDDVHLTVAGNAVVGDELARAIVSALKTKEAAPH